MLAVSLAIKGLETPRFAIQDFSTYCDLLPTNQDVALLSLMERFFRLWTSSSASSTPTSFSYPSPLHLISSFYEASSETDNDVARFLTF